MNKTALIKKRLRYTKIIGRILAWLPFVRCVILNGSLASGGHKESSDIDILIIARAGRIFSARFFINAFGTMLGIKRSKDESKNHAGKFCFNYFLTENFLKIPTGRGGEIDRYCAQNYSASRFIAGDENLFMRYMEANEKIFSKYGCKVSSLSPAVISTPQELRVEKSSNKRSLDRVYPALRCGARDDRKVDRDGKQTSRFERWAKHYQIKRIESDSITKKYPNLIVYNDNELRFHPPRQNK